MQNVFSTMHKQKVLFFAVQIDHDRRNQHLDKINDTENMLKKNVHMMISFIVIAAIYSVSVNEFVTNIVIV